MFAWWDSLSLISQIFACIAIPTTVVLTIQTVLMLIAHSITARGIQFSFKAVEADAVRMCEAGVLTAEDAEAFFAHTRKVHEGTRAVLRRLGKRRQPSQDEMDLYRKWTDEWHYAPEAILEACSETTKGDIKRNMGIGLSVCSAIVKAHGGEISAQNRPNGGASFTFSLEMEDSDEQQ